MLPARLLAFAALLAAVPVAAQSPSKLHPLTIEALLKLRLNTLPISPAIAQCILNTAPQGVAPPSKFVLNDALGDDGDDDEQQAAAELNDAITKIKSAMAARVEASPRDQFFTMAGLFYNNTNQRIGFANAAIACRRPPPPPGGYQQRPAYPQQGYPQQGYPQQYNPPQPYQQQPYQQQPYG